MTAAPPAVARQALLDHALRLEYLTVVWNVIEGVIAVSAALVAGSVALFGFGIDSFVESTSGLVLVWRLRTERDAGASAVTERIEERGRRMVALTLFGLAGYVLFDAGFVLWRQERPEPSLVGIVLTTVSLAVMRWLAGAKRRAARGLNSRALEADAFQTTACWWLSLTTLSGLALNAVVGWWWADPVAAILISVLIAREGREFWEGGQCCG